VTTPRATTTHSTPVPTSPQPGRRASAAAPAALAALALLAAACGTDDAPGPLEPTGEVGRVRFVNVITDTARGRVNVKLEGVPFGVNLTYATTTPATLPAPSTALYAPVYVGDRTLVLTRTADTTAAVATLAFTAAADDRTVYAIGGAGGTAITPFVTSDTNAAPAAGEARVRAVHLSPTAGPVDLFVTAPGANLAAATPTLANVPYQGVSAYLALPAGTYQLRAVPAGTPPADRPARVAINLASLALAAGSARTIVAADNATGGAPLRAFVLVDR
jgi:hypothetical protein